jgi:hypothetical protein
MSGVVDGLLRLAWYAETGGKPGTRDALLTLAVAECIGDDAALAERCRRLVVAYQPGHWYATSPTLAEALGRGKVAEAMAKLRAMFPPVRVRHLLLREAMRRGPYTGRRPSPAKLLDDLAPAGSEIAVYAAPRALPFLAPAARAGGGDGTVEVDPDGSLARFYLSVLLAIAVLLQSVLAPGSSEGSKAA